MVFNQNYGTIPEYQDETSYEDDDDIIIPTLNPGYQSAPDYDIIADDDIADTGEMQPAQYEGAEDDNIMSDGYNDSNYNYDENYQEETSFEKEANLARLPGNIQIERIVEQHAWN